MTRKPSTSTTSNSRSWIVYALAALAVAALVGRQAVAYGSPFGFASFVAVCAYSAVFNGAQHLHGAWTRSKAAPSGAHRGGDR